MKTKTRSASLAAALWVAFALTQACSCDDDGGTTSNESGGAGGGAGDSGFDGISIDGAGGTTGCPGGCPEGQICNNGFCVTQTACTDDDSCQNDSYCEPSAGCIPWGTPPGKTHDPTCQVGLPPGNFAPAVRCEFSVPPAGDPFPDHRDVQATPMVVNFNAGGGGVPSIVAPFTATVPGSYTENQGVIRVLRGDDCTLEANLGAGQAGYSGWLISSSPVAVGDLDGDGSAEIVSFAADGHIVAFTRKALAWGVLWVSTDAVGGGNWAGPSIHDLDDDGIPEVIREGTVLDGLTGATKGASPAGYASYSVGLNPVLANLDQDPAVELTNGQYIWEWTSSGWALDATFPGATPSGPGFAAVADFGAYGSGPASDAEIVVVRNNTVMIHALDGSYAMAPIAVPAAGLEPAGGGAPTVADYDGDGLPEVGVAGRAFLTVFDIDCTASPRTGGTCSGGAACDDASGAPGPCAAGILWSRRTQDISSNITGSSVFDFEADGKAEVVYADECFVRVYNGTNGEVVFSQYRSSCTWYENPIVADTDGNFRADLVTPSNLACASDPVQGIACSMLDPSGVDTQFAGLRCKLAADCVSGVCDGELCRCSASAECCGAGTDAACTEQGFSCAPPPAGTPGSGNTCRAGRPHGVQGIRVYADALDRWVRSRTIWSQHAYHVTHINEDGTIPKTSAWQKNWTDPKLNNFRQNVPGDASGKDAPDITAGVSGFSCQGTQATLTVPVCNRGSAPIGAGIGAAFYDGATKVCEAQTSKPLQPGECEVVSCVWATPPTDPVDIRVVTDEDGEKTECKEGNNEGTVKGVFCEGPA
jgi:hypothetical protein